MKIELFRPWAVLLLALLPVGAALADDAEIRSLREELRQLKENYEQRIGALEKRLGAAESRLGQAEETATHSQLTALPLPASVGNAETAFNPGVSLILGGTYTRLTQSPSTYAIGGFIPSGGDVAPPPRSFALGESELSFAANVDHLFRGVLTASVPPQGSGMNAEEAFVQTLDLPTGLNIKAGRFLSGLGYLNEQHAHAWDFADAPLAYSAFFGGQLKNDGVQLKWLAPTDTFVEMGVEAARGGPFPSTDRDKNGNSVAVLFAHSGGDVGIAHSWRAGLSYLETAPHARVFTDPVDGSDNAFSGHSRTAIADFIWKWAPNGNSTETNFKLQGEYLRRNEDGDLSTRVGTGSEAVGAYASRQSGWYLQAVYQFMPRWRVGTRLDRLDYGSVDAAVALPSILQPYNPSRFTLMTDWTPSEFSRLRLQWARDESRPGSIDNQLWLQYVMSLGVHGAHKF